KHLGGGLRAGRRFGSGHVGAPDGGGYTPAKVDVQTIVLATQHTTALLHPSSTHLVTPGRMSRGAAVPWLTCRKLPTRSTASPGRRRDRRRSLAAVHMSRFVTFRPIVAPQHHDSN